MQLSNIPSEILLQATLDLEAVEKMKGIEVFMDDWVYVNSSNKCQVCHAGAVMINSLGCRRTSDPDDFDLQTRAKLIFINRVREGYIHDGFEILKDFGVIDGLKFNRINNMFTSVPYFDEPPVIHNIDIPFDVIMYSKDKRKEYKEYIAFVIGMLQAEGM